MAEARDPTLAPRIFLRVAALGALAFAAATAVQYMIPAGPFCEPGGGCDAVRAWAQTQRFAGYSLGQLLPFVGVLGFTSLFVGSLIEHRGNLRVVGALAIAGALIAAALLVVQASAIGSYCWLCIGADGFALLAGGAGAWLLAVSRHADPEGGARFKSPWWSLWTVALLAPVAWAGTLPDPGVPPVIRARYVDGALNVVEVADFECPFCRAMHPVLKAALAEVDGPVNLVRIVLPLEFHAHARDAARAYFCAVRAERGEPMADRLFAADDLSREGTIELARELELDPTSFTACLDDPAIEAQIREHERLADESNNQGLPTLYIGARTLIGFDRSAGAEPFRDAIRAAQRGEGERMRVWPLAGLAALALAIAALTRRR